MRFVGQNISLYCFKKMRIMRLSRSLSPFLRDFQDKRKDFMACFFDKQILRETPNT